MHRVKEARRHTALGLDAYDRGDLELAEAEFVSALWFAAALGTAADTARRAYLNLAVVYIEQAKYLEGRQLLRQALTHGFAGGSPEIWEPAQIWGFYRADDDSGSIDRLLPGVRRTLRQDALDPVPALRALARYESMSARRRSSSLLLALANAI